MYVWSTVLTILELYTEMRGESDQLKEGCPTNDGVLKMSIP